MTREQAAEIIRKEYKCVDRDCDIERSCGKCDLMMPSKEPILQAYDMAIQALEQEPTGHWIVHPKGVYAHLVCDKCLSNAPYDCCTNYCPNCGARMVELQESEDKE